MTSRTILAALSFMSIALPVQSEASTSAAELYEACSYLNQAVSGIRIPDGALQKVNFCMGFVEAGADGLLLGALVGADIKNPKEAGEKLHHIGVPYACVPSELVNIERVRIFLRYFEAHAESLKAGPPSNTNAINALMISVAEAYPCK